VDGISRVVGDATSGRDLIADIELVERFCLHWDQNAGTYVGSLDTLRAAARRLLPLANTETRLRELVDPIACLARNPLYFTEIYHGQRLQPDGSFAPLPHADRLHFWPHGLRSTPDQRATETIYERVLKSRTAPLRSAEIGSAVGLGSTRTACEFVKPCGGTLYCIDPWIDPSWYFAFLANMMIHDLESTVIPIRSSSRDAARLFDDKSLDAVFLDGSHIYPDVLADVDAYLPKVRKGGFLFGHDLHDLPSCFDRNELLAISGVNNADANYTDDQGRVVRVNVHPGVVLAVQDRFGDEVEQFPDSSIWAKQV
jgi:predicted O-methyltransferase YrrM